MMVDSAGSDNALWVAPTRSSYRAYITLTGIKAWGTFQSMMSERGGPPDLMKDLIENCMKRVAEQDTVSGAFQWGEYISSIHRQNPNVSGINDGDTNAPIGQSMNIQATRERYVGQATEVDPLSPADEDSDCDTCSCHYGSPDSEPDDIPEDQLSEAPDDFYFDDGGQTRRSIETYNLDDKVNPLSKRYDTCGVEYENNNYPKALEMSRYLGFISTNTAFPSTCADVVPAITKYLDWRLNSVPGK